MKYNHMHCLKVEPTRRARRTRYRAFSLLELLVVIGIIGLLVALLLPALRRARRMADVGASLATMRQFQQALSMYNSDSKDRFPYMAKVGDPSSRLMFKGREIPYSEGMYFRDQSSLWANLVLPYLSGEPTLRTGGPFYHKGFPGMAVEPDWEVLRSRYYLTYAAFADPAYWVGDRAPEDGPLYRSTMSSEVAFPSQKGLLLDIAEGAMIRSKDPSAPEGALVGLADGSADLQEWNWGPVLERPYGALPWPVLSTINGLRGRDF